MADLSASALRHLRRALLAGSALATIGGGALAQSAAAAGAAERPSAIGLEEVIVMATKRPENVEKIAGSVTALSGESLQAAGASSYADYLAKSPGVLLNDSVPGYSTVTIRGIATSASFDQGQGTTGFYVNDIPLTDPSLSLGNPDIDTFDVGSVAVLRGPQGSLFGASALGGAINYQTTQPDLGAAAFAARATVSSTRHGNTGGSVKLMGNVPLADERLAVRGVYINRIDAGYIDNLGIGDRDANRTRTEGGRLMVRAKPTDTTTVDYMYLYQEQDTRDRGLQQPSVGALAKRSTFPERAKLFTRIHSLRVDQETSWGVISGLASVVNKDINQQLDFTTAPLAGLFGRTVRPLEVQIVGGVESRTGELRIASPADQRFEYVAGVFVNDTDYHVTQPIYGPGATAAVERLLAPTFGAGIGQRTAPNNSITEIDINSKEYAAFGEASYRIIPTLKLTVGGRLFRSELEGRKVESGALNLLQTGQIQGVLNSSQTSDGFLPKASLSWEPAEDLLVYALVSKGFRIGGPNVAPPDPAFPTAYGPDSLYNYEAGVRGAFFDRRLLLSATAFYIDWSSIQLRVLSAAGFTYAVNAGQAKSRGVEFTGTLRPVSGLTLSGGVSYLKADLDSDFRPSATSLVPKGSQLPGAPKWQTFESLEYVFEDSALRPTFAISHRYTSKSPSAINLVGGLQGGYQIVDARVSIERDGWDATLFANNLFDKGGITFGTTSPGVLSQYVTRPRTVGVMIGTRF